MSRPIQPHDVRELLQYVPKFAGKIFAIELRWKELSDHLKSEMMLDCSMLQQVGVKLIFIVESGAAEDLIDWGIDVDLKLASDVQHSPQGLNDVISRGQFGVIEAGEGYIDQSVVGFIREIEVDKVLLLLGETNERAIGKGVSISIEDWLSRGESGDFGDRIPSLLERGVSRVHLLDALIPGVILSELFSNEGSGLMIYRDSYRQIRSIKAEDIPELLTMIGRSVRTSLLVPRKYEDIESELADYYVYQIDDNVVGCVALHQYADNSGEIACLYVKNGHQGHGYGERLVQFAEEQARLANLNRIFALTTGAVEFFVDLLKYQKIDKDAIPEERLRALEESGRDSLAVEKTLT